MAQKKLLTIAGLLVTAGAAGVLGLSHVSAESSTGDSNLAEKIAQKFNLNKDEVQKVFDEAHAERKAEHHAKIEERLTQAVKDGKLTEEQKSKILAKLEEIKQDRPSKEDLEGKTDKERRALKVDKHEDLEQWAKDNDIPEEYLLFKVRGPGPGGAGGAKMRFERFEDKQ